MNHPISVINSRDSIDADNSFYATATFKGIIGKEETIYETLEIDKSHQVEKNTIEEAKEITEGRPAVIPTAPIPSEDEREREIRPLYPEVPQLSTNLLPDRYTLDF